MKFFRTLSYILFIPPFVTLAYDLVKGWFVDATLNIRPLKEWWTDVSPDTLETARMILLKVTTVKYVDQIMDTMAPVVLAFPPLLFYLLYRLIFLIKGGHSTGKFTYKSRH